MYYLGHFKKYHIIKIVAGVEVIIENLLPEVRKMFLRGRRLRQTFYELRAQNFQC